MGSLGDGSLKAFVRNMNLGFDESSLRMHRSLCSVFVTRGFLLRHLDVTTLEEPAELVS